jgi:uncharacterized membrane protein
MISPEDPRDDQASDKSGKKKFSLSALKIFIILTIVIVSTIILIAILTQMVSVINNSYNNLIGSI